MPESGDINEAVQVSVPMLVRIGQQGAALPLDSGIIRARLTGNYQSAFKGRGMEFDESRLYQPGDDIRNIDWRVTARTGKTHTKLFREERERPVFLWVDFRASMFFATRGCFKSVVAARLASLLAWSAVHRGDRIGGLIFSDAAHREVKPMRGRAAALKMIRHLVDDPAWSTRGGAGLPRTAVAPALSRLRRVARPGSLIFLISDFRYLDNAAESQLHRLSRHSDLVMIFIHDPLEQSLPRAGQYRVSDGRTDVVLDTFDVARIERYRQRFRRHEEHLAGLCRSQRAYMIDCATTADPLAVLQDALSVRSRRR
jgi:uncharacterized protein (DUF58 family)